MTAIIFKTCNNSSQRKIRGILSNEGVPYTERNITTEPLSKEEFMRIITKTEHGIEDIKSRNYDSIVAQILESEGVDVEDISLSDFHKIVAKNPRILISPLTIYKGELLVGYREDRVGILASKESRQKAMNSLLERMVSWENEEFDAM